MGERNDHLRSLRWFLPLRHEEKIFKAFYSCACHPYRIAYATSKDGLLWEKPSLGIVEFRGSTENNLIFKENQKVGDLWLTGDYGCGSVSVMKRNWAEPERRYFALYLTGSIPEIDMPGGICLAYSCDGIHWIPYAKNPVIPGHSDTSNNILWDERIEKYVVFMRPNVCAHVKRRTARTESPDLFRWSKPAVTLFPDELDTTDTQLYGVKAFIYEGLYLGLLQVWRSDRETDTIDVQLVHSRDGVSWNRQLVRAPFIPRGPDGSFDSHVIFAVAEPLIVGDEMWFYYGGFNEPHKAPGRTGQPAEGVIGLAALRLDGFFSMEAREDTSLGEDEGYLLTRPFICEGRRLEMNAATSRDGAITVEVWQDKVDTRVKPFAEVVKGFTKDDCDSFVGDDVHHDVTWNGSPDLTAVYGQEIRLKFTMKNAKLYSFQIQT